MWNGLAKDLSELQPEKQVASLASRHGLKTVHAVLFLCLRHDSDVPDSPTTIETTSSPPTVITEPAKGRSSVRTIAAVLMVVFLAGAVLGRVGYVQYYRQKEALREMRLAVEQSLAPGEVVVVDDPVLGWALRRGSDGVLRDSVLSVRASEPANQLLARLRQSKTTEVLVVATPDDTFVRHLDAAGFSVAQEVGWVPWDLNGTGRALLGRGRKRIFFAVVPRESPKN